VVSGQWSVIRKRQFKQYMDTSKNPFVVIASEAKQSIEA